MTDFDSDNKQHTSSIDTVFTNLQRFFLDQGIPVVMGETSATNTQNNTEAREKWAYYMGAKSSAYGIPICVWDNGSSNPAGGESHCWVRRSQNPKLRSQKDPLPFPTIVESLFAGAASIAWGTGREAAEPVKSRLNGTVLWADEAGRVMADAIVLDSQPQWYAQGRQFAIVYTGEGSMTLRFETEQDAFLLEPSAVNPVGKDMVAWFPYDAVMQACSDADVTALDDLLRLSVLSDGQATVYEVCYVGK